MAFTLGAWTKAHQAPFLVGAGGLQANQPPTIANHFELADQAASTSPVMQAPQGIALARIVGRQKGWGSGSGSVGPIYELQVAYDSGFTSQVRTITQFTARRTGTDQSWVQDGVVPDAQSYTFARVLITLSGTDVITADFLIDLLPGI